MEQWMDWQQKLAAIMAAGNQVHLDMREPGCWRLHNAPRLVEDSTITTLDGKSYPSPEAAVEGWWSKMLECMSKGRCLDVWDGEDQRRVVWNGFMWKTAA
jgi:hypothetical protein